MFTFDAKTKMYICGEYYYNQDYAIYSGKMQAYKNQPMYLEFVIKGYGSYKANFSKHGEISLNHEK